MVRDLHAYLPPAPVARAIRRVVAQLVLDAEVVGNLRVDRRELFNLVRRVHAASRLLRDFHELLPGLLVNRLFILLRARRGVGQGRGPREWIGTRKPSAVPSAARAAHAAPPPRPPREGGRLP